MTRSTSKNIFQLCGFSFCSDGFKFYRSSNNVILCPGNEQGFLPPKYFEKVVQIRPSKYKCSILITNMYIVMRDCKLKHCDSLILWISSWLLYLYHLATCMKCQGPGRLQPWRSPRLQDLAASYAFCLSANSFWAGSFCWIMWLLIVRFREGIAFFCHLIFVNSQWRW